MSKINQLQRQLLIVRKVINDGREEKFPSIYNLISYLERHNFIISIPTIKRDFACIKADFKVDMEYSEKERGYFIETKLETNSIIQFALENFEILSSINRDGGMPEFVIPEKRKAKGTEHFYILTKCIEAKRIITFKYHKYETNTITQPNVAPQAIKESRGRWYLLGIPKNETGIKSYGLDRMGEIQETGEYFKKRLDVEIIEKHYTDCFAMFTSTEESQKVVLSFDERDGSYISSFPIHHSQRIEHENNLIIVTLNIKITLDFIMELMSRAWSIEVLEPQSLREELHRYFTEASKRNK